MSNPLRFGRLVVALCDGTTIVLLAGAALTVVLGSLRVVAGGTGYTIGWPQLTFAALAVAAIRHAAVPTPSIIAQVRGWRSAVAARPPLADALLAFWLTRPAVLIVGLLAVATIGLPPGSESAGGRRALSDLPARFDANWYAGIAAHGYEWRGRGQFDVQQNIAFFPGYPMLMRGLGIVTGAFQDGVPASRTIVRLTWCGLAISLAAFLWAAWYFARLARELLDESQARAAVWLLSAYPFALFFSAAYSEPVFLLGALGAWWHLRRGELVRSALWGLAAGLVRSNGFLLSVPLGLVALGIGLSAGDDSRAQRLPPDAIARRATPSLAARLSAAAAPGLAMLAVTAYFHSLTGVWFVWARAHGAWGRRLEAPGDVLAGSLAPGDVFGWIAANPYQAFNAAGLAFAVLLIVPVWRRVGPAWAAYIVLSIVPPLLLGGLLSMGRITATLFPLFLALAAILPPRFVPVVVTVCALLQALAAALFYTWRELY